MNEPNHAIAIREADPGEIIAKVNHVAGACFAIVGASVMQIQGRNYIKVEGWQAIAAAHGCTASADSVAMVDGGIAATATIRRLTDGAILGQAEGFVGDDESMWAKRPLYARRAMAQTRAISRACRSAFAHVVVAMNAGHGTTYSTTPAEEVPVEGFDDRRAPVDRADVRVAPFAAPAKAWTAEQKAEAASLAAKLKAAGHEATALEIKNAAKGRDPVDVLNDLSDAVDSLVVIA